MGAKSSAETKTKDVSVIGCSTTSPTNNEQVQAILHDFHLPEVPDIIPLKSGQHVVAIGDIHGNYTLLFNVLLASGLIEKPAKNCRDISQIQWVGGDCICVFIGDYVDRGYCEELCMRLICKLAQEAPNAGGTVVCLWGNHESENAEGDFKAVVDNSAFLETFAPIYKEKNAEIDSPVFKQVKRTPETMYYFDRFAIRSQVFAPGSLMAKAFLSKLKVVAKIGRTIFVHGSLLVEHLDAFGGGFQGMEKLNKKATDWVLKPWELGDEEFLDCFVLNGPDGPHYARHFAMSIGLPEEEIRSKLDAVLKCLDADRMVVGHTMQKQLGGVNSAHDEKVWRVDVGDGQSERYDRDAFISNLALEITKQEDGKERAQIIQRTTDWQRCY